MENVMENLMQKVRQWAAEKGIFEKGNPTAQWFKMHEEVHELIEAYAEGNPDEVKLEAGDVGVTWVIWCAMNNLCPKDCLQQAYDKISKREGKMVNGSFVKIEDLHSETKRAKNLKIGVNY